MPGRPSRSTPSRPAIVPARSGQALVESALALALLLAVVASIVEVALYAQARQVAVAAAQEGARVASADGRTLDDGVRQARALLALGLGRGADRLAVSPVCARIVAGACRAEVVALRVEGERELALLGGAVALPLTVEVSMYVERGAGGPAGAATSRGGPE
ncbi:MAG: pilus assembly protein [Chloroflexi bacterium]|nr:pilus assembly protein [Chloroflexota bacterium]